jgi:hypothetical protein
MSKISLTPNASGTGNFTIASPNSNTDRTLTLPDATGTINTSGAVNEVPAGTASAPSIYPTGDTNTGIFFPAADTIGFTEGGVESMRLDSSGNLQFNSGYGSVVTAYGCRAWVNFDGVNNPSVSGTYSQSGTTVTVTITNHGLIAGDIIYADITTGTGVDGRYTVATVTSSSVFTYTAGTSLTTSGNITLVRSTIRASANVSTVADLGTGAYVVNFTTAMPDANYCFSLSGGRDTGGAPRIIGQSTNTPTASSLRIQTINDAGADANSEYVCVAIFR